MKNLINTTIYETAQVNGKWYVKNEASDRTESTLSFGSKFLADMLCANMMGYTVSTEEFVNASNKGAYTEVA